MKIAIGRLTKPHGVHGEIKLQPYFEEAVLQLVGHDLAIEPESGKPPVSIKLTSVRGGALNIARLEGIDTPEKIREITPCTLLAEREQIPDPPDGKYYYEEIVGLPVYDPEGNLLGKLKGFFNAGEKDVWEIKTPDGGEILTPCMDETLKEVDLKKGRIVMKLMEETE